MVLQPFLQQIPGLVFDENLNHALGVERREDEIGRDLGGDLHHGLFPHRLKIVLGPLVRLFGAGHVIHQVHRRVVPSVSRLRGPVAQILHGLAEFVEPAWKKGSRRWHSRQRPHRR